MLDMQVLRLQLWKRRSRDEIGYLRRKTRSNVKVKSGWKLLVTTALLETTGAEMRQPLFSLHLSKLVRLLPRFNSCHGDFAFVAPDYRSVVVAVSETFSPVHFYVVLPKIQFADRNIHCLYPRLLCKTERSKIC